MANNIKNVTLRQFALAFLISTILLRRLKRTWLYVDDCPRYGYYCATSGDSAKVLDIADIEYFTVKKGAGNLQPFDTRSAENRQDRRYFQKRKMTSTSKIAQGTAPHTVGLDPRIREFAKEETNWYTLVPTICNADTLGIRPDLIKRPINSWSELLNPEFKGKASILNIASIGIMDAAMVCEAMVRSGDKGNMTKAEIDKTMAIFTEAKKSGQFRAWKSLTNPLT